MRSVVGIELAHNAFQACLDRIFRDEERVGDVAIAAALGDQLKDACLPIRQLLLPHVLGNLLRYVRGDGAPAYERTADGADDLLGTRCLQEIRPRAQRKSARDAGVPEEARQNNDDSIGEFFADDGDSLQAVYFGHLQINEQQIRPQITKALNGLFAIAGFTDNDHVMFGREHGSQAIPDHGMVIGDENAEPLWRFVQSLVQTGDKCQ